MRCKQIDALPQASASLQVRQMQSRPVHVAVPAASVKVIVRELALLQLSVAVAVPVFEGLVDAPHCRFASAGQVITGAVLSFTVMVWVQLAELPQPSVAL